MNTIMWADTKTTLDINAASGLATATIDASLTGQRTVHKDTHRRSYHVLTDSWQMENIAKIQEEPVVYTTLTIMQSQDIAFDLSVTDTHTYTHELAGAILIWHQPHAQHINNSSYTITVQQYSTDGTPHWGEKYLGLSLIQDTAAA